MDFGMDVCPSLLTHQCIDFHGKQTKIVSGCS